jgi:hypothetical protein
MRSLRIVLIFLILLFGVQAYGAPLGTAPSAVGTNGNGGLSTPYTTTVPAGAGFAGVPAVTTTVPAGAGFAGVPATTTTLPAATGFAAAPPEAPIQPIAPENPFATSNAPTTTLQGGTGLSAAASGTVSSSTETPLYNVNTAASVSQGFSSLSPGAGANSGLSGGYPSGGGSLATAPGLSTTPTTSTSALASTEEGTTGTVSNPGGVAPAPNMGQP